MTQSSKSHSSDIERTGSGDETEYAVSCSCRTHYVGRLSTYAKAVAERAAHKAAVADGTWQAQQDAKAARLAALAPKHAAIREHNDAKDERQSAGFAYLIAKQQGGDIEQARADLDAATARLAAAEAALSKFAA